MKSYFKVLSVADTRGAIFPFDGTDTESVRRAYDQALRLGGRVSVWSRPVPSGPWDHVPLIGEVVPSPRLVA